jgi:hypothetical protein
MNRFSDAAVRLIDRHGKDITYKTTVEGAYNPETGSVANTTTQITVKAYPKTVRTNAYSSPDLINKTVVEWMIASILMTNKPEPQDIILDGTDIYSVYRCYVVDAHGENTVYRVVSIKG